MTCSCSETRELYVLYSLTLQLGKPAITSSIKRNAALESVDGGKHSMLHVVEGDAGNLRDAFAELCKFFGLSSADADLCDFLQALNVTQVGCYGSHKPYGDFARSCRQPGFCCLHSMNHEAHYA